MITTISNEYLNVSVNSFGAEICSIKSADEHEYLWQGDPDIWSGQAPNLFPFIGKINNDTYEFDGKAYAMSKHGFTRTSEFTQINQSNDSVTYQLCDSSDTRDIYPFRFNLNITFKLKKNKLLISYQVINKSETVMPFSLGAHPAFALNWTTEDEITDYYLEFDQVETASYQQFNGVALGRKEHPSLINSTILNITKSMFEIDATIYKGLKSDTVTLRSKLSNRNVKVLFPEFTYLGLWAKPGAPYLCIEPWFGVDDYEDHQGQLLEKDGIEIIESGKEFHCQYSIEIN